MYRARSASPGVIVARSAAERDLDPWAAEDRVMQRREQRDDGRRIGERLKDDETVKTSIGERESRGLRGHARAPHASESPSLVTASTGRCRDATSLSRRPRPSPTRTRGSRRGRGIELGSSERVAPPVAAYAGGDDRRRAAASRRLGADGAGPSARASRPESRPLSTHRGRGIANQSAIAPASRMQAARPRLPQGAPLASSGANLHLLRTARSSSAALSHLLGLLHHRDERVLACDGALLLQPQGHRHRATRRAADRQRATMNAEKNRAIARDPKLIAVRALVAADRGSTASPIVPARIPPAPTIRC